MERAKVDFFDLYFQYVEKTEPPTIYHRWALIASLSAYLGRQVWIPFGEDRIFPNHYVMMVGEPGTRKSTAIKKAAKLIRAAGYDTFAAEKTTKEKFILDLAGVDSEDKPFVNKGSGIDILANLNLKGGSAGQDTAEMFIAADEFNTFMGPANVDFQALLGVWWDWDDQDRGYEHRLKNSKSVSVFQPTISILGGNTPSQFAECFPLASIGQGFMSRLILIHSEPSGKKFFPIPPPPQGVKEKLIDFLQQIKLSCHGAMEMAADAESALHSIYMCWAPLEDTRFQHYSTRRMTHLLKLCIIVTACRLSMRITIEDVIYANTILSYAESTMPKAIGELGKSRNAEAANKIMQALYVHKMPMSAKDLWKVVQNDLDKLSALSELLMGLEHAGKVQSVRTPQGPTYLPVTKTMSRSTPYTNFDLLKGRESK